MRTSNLIDINKLITLFFVFTLATTSLFILLFIPIAETGWQGKLRIGLFFFSFFAYGFVMLSFIVHYLEKAKTWVTKDKTRIVITIACLLALSHAIFMALKDNSWLTFFGYLAGDGLIIFGLSSTDKIMGKLKWGKKKKNSGDI